MRLTRVDIWPLAGIAACGCVLVFQVVLLGKLPDHYDFWLQEYVHLAFLHRALQGGELPMWNPQLVGGTPHLADPQTAVLYPFTTLPALVLPPQIIERFSIPFHFALAGASTYLLSRALGSTRIGAAVAGLGYTLAPHFAPLEVANFLQQSAAWAPAIACALVLAMRRKSLGYYALAGALWAMQLLRGYAQTWYVSGLAAALWLAVHMVPHARPPRTALRRALLGAGLFAAVGLGLAAAQLLPSLDLLRESQRSAGFTIADADGPGRITLANLLGVAGPDAEVSGAFPGGAVLALALTGLLLARNAGKRWLAGVAALALCLCLGSATPLWAAAYRLIPGFATLHMPHRLLFLWSLPVSLLAGMGADVLARRERPPLWPAVAAGASALAVLWIATLSTRELSATGVAGLVRLSAGVLAVVIAVRIPWRDLPLQASVRRRLAASVLPAVVAVDLLSFSLPRLYGTYYSPAAVYTPPPVATWLAQRAAEAERAGEGPFRFASDTPAELPEGYGARAQDNRRLAFLPPNVPALYAGLEAAQGYLAIRTRATGEFFGAINDLGRDPRVLSIYDPHTRLVDLLGVRYFVTGDQDSVPVQAGGAFSIISGDGARRASPDAPVVASALELWSSTGDSIALGDGDEVARITVATSAGATELVVRAGEHTAEWVYDVPGVAGTVRHHMAPVARSSSRDGGGHTWVYRAIFPLPPGTVVSVIDVRVTHPRARLNVDRVVLHMPLTSRFRLAYEAPPARVWENSAALPRAWWVPRAAIEPDVHARFARLKDASFDPTTTVLLDMPPATPATEANPDSSGASRVTVTHATTNTLAVSTDSPTGGYLVVSQNYDPGWHAAVDGRNAAVLRADANFTAIALPAGTHQVLFTYLPSSVLAGGALSTTTALGLAGWLVAWQSRRRRAPRPAPGDGVR